jgi:uncharacterized protein YxjI
MVLRRSRGSPEQSPDPESATGAAAPDVAVPATVTRYRLTDQLAATDDDFFVQTGTGQRAFKVSGKSIRLRDTIRFEDMQGAGLCEVRADADGDRDTMVVAGPHGEHLATIRREPISPVRDQFTIELAGGTMLNVLGNVPAHEFEIADPAGAIAEVSRRWFRIRDSYGVEVAPGNNDALLLAAVVCIDLMLND